MTMTMIKLLTRTSLLSMALCLFNQACLADLTNLDKLASSQNSNESIYDGQSESGHASRSESTMSNGTEHSNQSSSEASRQGGTESGGFIHVNSNPRPAGLPSGAPAYMRAPASSDYVKSYSSGSDYATSTPQQSDYVKSHNSQESDYAKSSSQQSDYVKSTPQPSDYVKSTDSSP